MRGKLDAGRGEQNTWLRTNALAQEAQERPYAAARFTSAARGPTIGNIDSFSILGEARQSPRLSSDIRAAWGP